MLVKVMPEQIMAQLIGHRTVNRIQRWYYQVMDLPGLLLVTHEYPLSAFPKTAVLLVNREGTDSTIVCDLFPDAPAEWREMRLIQATLIVDRRLTSGLVYGLKDALERAMMPEDKS
jgi:hypothetical protein